MFIMRSKSKAHLLNHTFAAIVEKITGPTKQSSAREARQLKSAASRRAQRFFARLPARSWIASLRSQ
jgi:hypothetical protein